MESEQSRYLATVIKIMFINHLTSILSVIVLCIMQGQVFAMEISSGEEFYIACDNTGTPLAVFSNNGLLLKQVSVCFLVK